MKKSLLVLLCGLLAPLSAQYSFDYHPLDDLDNLALLHNPQILSMLGLRGRVYTIRIDETRFTRNGNRWVEGRRNVRYTALFDDRGRLREESQYSPTSDLVRRSGFIPNSAGAQEVFQVARSRIQNLWSSLPLIDGNGLIQSETITLEDGQTVTRSHVWNGPLLVESRSPIAVERFEFDPQGQILGATIQRTGEVPALRRLTRDASGRPVAFEWSVDGRETVRGTLIWNGEVLVSQEYVQDGKRFFVEYSQPDANGNWQRKVLHEVTAHGDRIPLVARYRRIHYYP